MTVPFDTHDAIKINEARKSFLQKFLPELIDKENIKTALDVGCGYGFFSNYLKSLGLQVTAVDGRLENVVMAKWRYPGIEFKACDIETPSCLNFGSFDFVLCFGLLYHLENPFQAIRNLFRLTKKYLFIETIVAPYKSAIAVLYEESPSDNQGLRYTALIPTESTFVKMLYKAGFKSIYKVNTMPQHEEFKRSLTRRKMRTMLLVSKNPEARELELRTLGFRVIPEPKISFSTPPTWDTKFGKLLHFVTNPQTLGLNLFDRIIKYIPSSLILKSCVLLVKPRTLRLLPGWFLGLGQSKTRISTLVRLLLWRAYSFKCLSDTFILKWHNGIKILSYPKVETCRSLFVTGYYEPNEFCFLQTILKPGMVFIDIGANIGLYTLFASNLVNKKGLVFTIEPSEREFRRLKANIDLNKNENIRSINMAVSNSSSERILLIAEEEYSGHNTFGEFAYEGVQSGGKQRVRTEKLDNLIQKEGLNKVDLIKIDVEGHEFFVLNGAKETLSKFCPILFVEIADRALIKQGCNSSQVLEFLSQLGYRIYSFDKTTGLPILSQKKVYFDSENIIAVHKTSVVQF